MGACDAQLIIRARNVKELKDRFETAQDECRHENGHSYSGGIGMANGLTILKPKKGLIFLSQSEAANAAEKLAEKWGPAIAAPYMDQNGKHAYYIYAICSS